MEWATMRRVLRADTFDSRSVFIRKALLPQLNSAFISCVACGWDFVAEVTSPSDCNSVVSWRTAVLILPQLLILLAFALHLVITLRYKKSAHSLVIVITCALVPLGVVALVHSGLRASIGICCCNTTLCPISSLTGSFPKSSSCSLVVRNCYMAFVRKIAHFVGTTALFAPLASLIFTTLSGIAQRRLELQNCSKFLEKTRN